MNENETVKVRTVIDEKMQKEFSARSERHTLAMIILGSVGTVVFLVLFVLSEFISVLEDSFTLPFLILFAALLGGGIGLKILLSKAVKQVRNCGKVNEYEFSDGYFTINQILNGETVATAKFYNNQILKVKESKNFFFVYINAAQVFPVTKAGLTEDELNVLKTAFRLNKPVE